MSKRVAVALCLLLSALLAGAGSYIYLENVSESILVLTDSISVKCRSGEDYSEDYASLRQLWDRHSVFLAVILKHSDADTLDRFFMFLEDAEESSDRQMLVTVLSQLDAYILVTVQGEAPRVENIF